MEQDTRTIQFSEDKGTQLQSGDNQHHSCPLSHQQDDPAQMVQRQTEARRGEEFDAGTQCP